MAGLLNDLDSKTLGVLAGKFLPGDLGGLSRQEVDGPGSHGAPNPDLAQIFATLAVAQAIRELRDAIAKAGG